VKPVKVTSSSSLVPAIMSGSLDIGTGDGAAVCSGILGGNDLTVVGANLNTFALETWARKDVTSFQDLAGKTVAVTGSGSTSDFALEASLKANGMERSDVKVAFVNTLPATVAAVQSGAVDATPVVPPHGDALAPKGFKMIYDTSKLPHVSTAMAVQPSYAKDHADAIRGFTKAMREAVVAASDPANDAAISTIVAKRAAVSKEEAEYTVKYFQPLWNQSLVVQPDVWTSTCTEARRKTKPKPGVDPDKALDMSFLDQSAK
jgi:ABC-type nitrate/sulfonate/bicarbonate transport system substrate-binding protein